jgi:uncharacterized protein (TIGR00725 family)
MTRRPAPRVVTVFGSSRPREREPGYAEARALGAALAAQGFIVCTGGYGGVMEAVSRGAKETGGRTLGVTSKFFSATANRWVDKEIRVKTWQERLFELIRRGHGFIVCTGGTGTLVELAVAWEMLNKGVMKRKPLIVLGEFWKPVIERVREVETAHESPWGEAEGRIIDAAHSPAHAAEILAAKLHPRG